MIKGQLFWTISYVRQWDQLHCISNPSAALRTYSDVSSSKHFCHHSLWLKQKCSTDLTIQLRLSWFEGLCTFGSYCPKQFHKRVLVAYSVRPYTDIVKPCLVALCNLLSKMGGYHYDSIVLFCGNIKGKVFIWAMCSCYSLDSGCGSILDPAELPNYELTCIPMTA